MPIANNKEKNPNRRATPVVRHYLQPHNYYVRELFRESYPCIGTGTLCCQLSKEERGPLLTTTDLSQLGPALPMLSAHPIAILPSILHLTFRDPMLSLTSRILQATIVTLSGESLHRTMSSAASRWPIQPYTPRHSSWPYSPADFKRADESPDTNFYGPARFVTHIDDNAIETLRSYYAETLPKRGKVLDLCSSWISHFPPELEAAASSKELEVIGMGMNKAELSANPILSSSHLVDLNANPYLPAEIINLDATVCVVSIDYLTQPLPVLSAILEASNPGASVHLILSNRCFPTKAIGRWLRISEDERVKMVGDYLWFAGWREVEAVTLVEPGMGRTWIGGGNDPLWVVRGKKT